MRRITKLERKGIIFILVGILVFAFLTDPVTEFVSGTFPNRLLRFVIGICLIAAVAYFGKLKDIK